MKTFHICAYTKIGTHNLGFQPIFIFLKLFIICVFSVFVFFWLLPAVYLLAIYCFSASSPVHEQKKEMESNTGPSGNLTVLLKGLIREDESDVENELK